MTNPLTIKPAGSMLENVSVLNDMLRDHGYGMDAIKDIASSEFIALERKTIAESSSIHLLAIKKILLYAIPVVAPPGANKGILLTSQVTTPAVQLSGAIAAGRALAIGDKVRLLGFAFPPRLINHLDMDIFPLKYYNKCLHDDAAPINLSALEFVTPMNVSVGAEKVCLYIIHKEHYEDAQLFNAINRHIAAALGNEPITHALQNALTKKKPRAFPTLERITARITEPFIAALNAVIANHVDRTFSASLYESLRLSGNVSLYDKIQLLGFSAASVGESVAYLKYVKEQRAHVSSNVRNRQLQLLLETRGEKIARETFPYLFDFTDSRAIFVRFNRFAMNKLPKDIHNKVNITLKKEIDSQNATMNNKCSHIQVVSDIHAAAADQEGVSEAFSRLEPLINFEALGADKNYPCRLCAYPMICAHAVELYESLASIRTAGNGSDQHYWATQKIINRYKAVDQTRTGGEGTEELFTYNCRYCGCELGKSEDIIQSSRKSQMETSGPGSDPIDAAIHTQMLRTIFAHMNQEIVPINGKAVAKLIFLESRERIGLYITRASKNEQGDLDTLIQYLSMVYTLAGLISINVNQIKSTNSIIKRPTKMDDRRPAEVSGAGRDHLKEELMAALKVIQQHHAFKRIGVTDAKIKVTLIEAYRHMNRAFVGEDVPLKAPSPTDRLIMDIKSGPIAAYANAMYRRNHGRATDDYLLAVGVDPQKLAPPKKGTSAVTALYAGIYTSPDAEKTDRGKYIQQSYQTVVNTAAATPVRSGYNYSATPPLDEFIQQYQNQLRTAIQMRRRVPTLSLPVENSREHVFVLQAMQIIYCSEKNVRRHEWNISKSSTGIIYVCAHCGINMDKASKAANNKITQALQRQRFVDAFFDLYQVACPVKDMHTFKNDVCTQCKATKSQLLERDANYFSLYETTFAEKCATQTAQLMESLTPLLAAAPKAKIEPKNKDKAPDSAELESLALNVGKLYDNKKLIELGKPGDIRVLAAVESYVRVLYSHYTFAKNAPDSIHYDVQFTACLKQNFKDSRAPDEMPALPEYPQANDADLLLFKLLTIIMTITTNATPSTYALIKFIVEKIAAQNDRHYEYNFAKLKTTTFGDSLSADLSDMAIVDDQTDEQEEMFYGYDMDQEDIEDNIDGEI